MIDRCVGPKLHFQTERESTSERTVPRIFSVQSLTILATSAPKRDISLVSIEHAPLRENVLARARKPHVAQDTTKHSSRRNVARRTDEAE